ncbi:MAG: glycerate kinase, partial [Eubacterium coprostanoligenes]|nr:glycerate kinase [Eubacterium coprostanoligenes]
MNILIVPDSYKGTLTSVEVAETIKSVIEKSSDCKVIALPFADGGEGFSAAMENICNGKRLYTKCHDIYGKEIDGYITVFDKTAVVECAVASGLQQRKNVMQSTSYGTGELIHFAIENGYNNIILGLGGTGCCDGGIGALSALGVRLYDENQNIMKMPKSNDMNYIFGISTKDKVKDINFTFACDVEN